MKNNLKKYWNPLVTTDVVLFSIEENELKVLLIKRSDSPFQNWLALPGGLPLKSETTYQAAVRILKEKAGVKNVYVEQLYTFDSATRDPRGASVSVTYFALVPREGIKIEKNKTTQTPEFVSVHKLPKLAFDHKDIIQYARKRLGYKVEYTNLVFSFLPKHFTLSQLQTTYELILGKKLDKRNFRKKFLQLGLIKGTSKIFAGARQRPAKLYELKTRQPQELKKFI